MSIGSFKVAVLGAGPYGLSVTAHLRSKGVETRIFGEPMEFWDRQMPEGMLLRSCKRGSSISDPVQHLRLDDYAEAAGIEMPEPVPLEKFASYGHWFQRKAVSDVDRRKVKRLEKRPRGFHLTVEDGEEFEAERVVIAAGIASFAYRPELFNDLPREAVSHSSDYREFSRFKNANVAVVGRGQSALESAALLAEADARVEVLVRGSAVRWLTGGTSLRRMPRIHNLLYPPAEVGPLGLNQIVAHPRLFRALPAAWGEAVSYRSIRPAVSTWVRPRIEGVRITTSSTIVSTAVAGDAVCLNLADGSKRCVDHVVLATGYRVDIAKYPFIAPELLSSIRQSEGYPVLSLGFESSVPGLFFVGATAAYNFGPLVRFIAGTVYCSKVLTRTIVRNTQFERNDERALDSGFIREPQI